MNILKFVLIFLYNLLYIMGIFNIKNKKNYINKIIIKVTNTLYTKFKNVCINLFIYWNNFFFLYSYSKIIIIIILYK